MRVRRSSGPSLTAALLVASLGVAGVSLGAAGKDAPLADAAQRGDTAAVQTLIEHGADIGARSNSVVQYLFDKGATLDVVARDGRTRLRVADGVEYEPCIHSCEEPVVFEVTRGQTPCGFDVRPDHR